MYHLKCNHPRHGHRRLWGYVYIGSAADGMGITKNLFNYIDYNYLSFFENCFESPYMHKGEPLAQSDVSLK